MTPDTIDFLSRIYILQRRYWSKSYFCRYQNYDSIVHSSSLCIPNNHGVRVINLVKWPVKMNILQNVIPQHDETPATKGALYWYIAWKNWILISWHEWLFRAKSTWNQVINKFSNWGDSLISSTLTGIWNLMLYCGCWCPQKWEIYCEHDLKTSLSLPWVVLLWKHR